jgi:hypothetical protein
LLDTTTASFSHCPIHNTKPSILTSRASFTRYSVFLLYWYKSTNTNAEGSTRAAWLHAYADIYMLTYVDVC